MWTRKKVRALVKRLEIEEFELAQLLHVRACVVYRWLHMQKGAAISERYTPSLNALEAWAKLKGLGRWTPDELVELRSAMGWSQRDACQFTGIHPASWSAIETGRLRISLQHRLKLDKTEGLRLAKEMLG